MKNEAKRMVSFVAESHEQQETEDFIDEKREAKLSKVGDNGPMANAQHRGSRVGSGECITSIELIGHRSVLKELCPGSPQGSCSSEW